jgi:hypothetical protein
LINDVPQPCVNIHSNDNISTIPNEVTKEVVVEEKIESVDKVLDNRLRQLSNVNNVHDLNNPIPPIVTGVAENVSIEAAKSHTLNDNNEVIIDNEKLEQNGAKEVDEAFLPVEENIVKIEDVNKEQLNDNNEVLIDNGNVVVEEEKEILPDFV